MNLIVLKLIFGIGCVLAYLIRRPYQRQRNFNVVTDSRINRREKLSLRAVLVGVVSLPVLYVLTPLLDFANYPMPQWASLLGIAIFAFSLWLYWRSHTDLGRNWSPSLEIQQEHALVCQGVYRIIRHPMYTSLWLWGLAQLLVLPNWIVGPAGLLSFGLMYFLRVHEEERMMLERFGDKYDAYARRTKRLIPYLF